VVLIHNPDPRIADFSAKGFSSAKTSPGSQTSATAFCRAGNRARMAERMDLMCSGVVPQQPPITCAPVWMKRLAYSAKYSEVAM